MLNEKKKGDNLKRFLNFIFSTNFELLSQIKGNSVKPCEFLEFVIYVQSGRFFTISGRPQKNHSTPLLRKLPLKTPNLICTVRFCSVRFL